MKKKVKTIQEALATLLHSDKIVSTEENNELYGEWVDPRVEFVTKNESWLRRISTACIRFLEVQGEIKDCSYKTVRGLVETYDVSGLQTRNIKLSYESGLKVFVKLSPSKMCGNAHHVVRGAGVNIKIERITADNVVIPLSAFYEREGGGI